MSDSNVVTASADSTVRLFETFSGTQLTVYRGHESAVLCVSIFGDLIVSGGFDGKLVFYNLKGMTLHTMRFNAPVSDLRISPNGGFCCLFLLGEGVVLLKIDLNNLKNCKQVFKWAVSEGKFLH